jgi:hypothetical protein
VGDREWLWQGTKRLLADPALFSRHVIGRALRPYQVEVVRAVLDSVWQRRGLTFTVMLARQMGKNELSAHLECYLLNLYRRRGGTIVKAAPTFRPQAVLSRLRLREVLDNAWNRRSYRLSGGYTFELGRARLTLLSGAPEANVVGATANILLEIDEAQDFSPEKYDRDFRPMGATANVTTVLYGTAWTLDGLLEREKRHNLEQERLDGVRRHFQYDWRSLAALSPEYGRYVEGEKVRLGATHPLFRTQYELEVLADEGRLLAAEQRAQLQGKHERQEAPLPEWHYVAGVDLAGTPLAPGGAAGAAAGEGEDAALRRRQPGRDSTVLTIAAIGPHPLPLARFAGEGGEGEGALFPTVRVVRHYWWTGRPQTDLYRQLLELLCAWNVRQVVVDASGVGAGVAGFLEAALGGRVEQFVFSQASKSKLGFELLAAINRDGVQVYRDDGSAEYREFWQQMRATRAKLRANRTLDFFVPEDEGHDDFVMSLALCLRAAGSTPPPAASTVLAAEDVLEDEAWGSGA